MKRNYDFLPTFSDDAAEYLEIHGWKPLLPVQNNTLHFAKNDRTITVKGDTILFQTWFEGEDGQRYTHLHVDHMVTGLDSLDFFKWTLLFHAMDVVPLKEFVAKARAEKTDDTLYSIFADQMKMQGARAELPTNY